MKYPVVKIDCTTFADWDTFHDSLAAAFQFLDYYGRNMDAWIDCMSDLETPTVLQLDCVQSLMDRCPEIYAAVVECSAFVNWRLIESGDQPLVFLAFYN